MTARGKQFSPAGPLRGASRAGADSAPGDPDASSDARGRRIDWTVPHCQLTPVQRAERLLYVAEHLQRFPPDQVGDWVVAFLVDELIHRDQVQPRIEGEAPPQ